jgi:hypothetical protein
MEVFACRLERRDIEKKGQEEKRKKLFLRIFICWYLVLVDLWLREEKRTRKGLSAQANLATYRLTDITVIDIE